MAVISLSTTWAAVSSKQRPNNFRKSSRASVMIIQDPLRDYCKGDWLRSAHLAADDLSSG